MSALHRTPTGDPWVGRVVEGRYRLLRRLGEGGMGVVYEAEHLKLAKRVAIKLISPERISDANIAMRFTREAMATAQIEHPHIAAGFDYGLLPEGGAFLVAQLVRGASLRDRVAAGPTPWREACALAAQIADAVSAIHDAGYVHRDLTPDNVLVSARGDGTPHVYVLDFGIAALFAAAPQRGPLTTAGTIVGTQGYMSPEQALGKPIGPRSDLYVLGVLLWEILAGRSMFDEARSLTEIVVEQLAAETPPLPEAPGASLGLPYELERLLRDLLAADPERRASSAHEVRQQLVRISEGRPAREPTANVATSSAAADAALLVNEAMTRVQPLTRRAIAVLGTLEAAIAIAAGATAGLLLVLAVGIASWRSDGDEPVRARVPKPTPAIVTAVEPALPVGVAEPEPLPPPIAQLIAARSRRAREAAATEVLSRDSTPPFARALALLALARDCSQRRAQLAALREDPDPRAIPAIESYRSAPRRGCGRRQRSDCHACIRDDLDDTLEALRAAETR